MAASSPAGETASEQLGAVTVETSATLIWLPSSDASTGGVWKAAAILHCFDRDAETSVPCLRVPWLWDTEREQLRAHHPGSGFAWLTEYRSHMRLAGTEHLSSTSSSYATAMHPSEELPPSAQRPAAALAAAVRSGSAKAAVVRRYGRFQVMSHPRPSTPTHRKALLPEGSTAPSVALLELDTRFPICDASLGAAAVEAAGYEELPSGLLQEWGAGGSMVAVWAVPHQPSCGAAGGGEEPQAAGLLGGSVRELLLLRGELSVQGSLDLKGDLLPQPRSILSSSWARVVALPPRETAVATDATFAAAVAGDEARAPSVAASSQESTGAPFASSSSAATIVRADPQLNAARDGVVHAHRAAATPGTPLPDSPTAPAGSRRPHSPAHSEGGGTTGAAASTRATRYSLTPGKPPRPPQHVLALPPRFGGVFVSGAAASLPPPAGGSGGGGAGSSPHRHRAPSFSYSSPPKRAADGAAASAAQPPDLPTGPALPAEGGPAVTRSPAAAAPAHRRLLGALLPASPGTHGVAATPSSLPVVASGGATSAPDSGSSGNGGGDQRAPSSNPSPPDLAHLVGSISVPLRDRLRRLRRKPQLLLTTPLVGWTLLLRAAHELDKAAQLQVLAVGAVGDGTQAPMGVASVPGSAAARFRAGSSGSGGRGRALSSASAFKAAAAVATTAAAREPRRVASAKGGSAAVRALASSRRTAGVPANGSSSSHTGGRDRWGSFWDDRADADGDAAALGEEEEEEEEDQQSSDLDAVEEEGEEADATSVAGSEQSTAASVFPAPEPPRRPQDRRGSGAPSAPATAAGGGARAAAPDIGDPVRRGGLRDLSSLARRRGAEMAQPLRRHHWVAVAPRYCPVLCDQYTAGALFDELVADSEPVKIRTMAAAAVTTAAAASLPAPHHPPVAGGGRERSQTGAGLSSFPDGSLARMATSQQAPPYRARSGTSDSAAVGVRSGEDHRSAAAASGSAAEAALASRRSSTASSAVAGMGSDLLHLAWTETCERVLTFDVFERYCFALARPLVTPPAAWSSLREMLRLDPREVVVKVEELMEVIISVELLVELQRLHLRQGRQAPVHLRAVVGVAAGADRKGPQRQPVVEEEACSAVAEQPSSIAATAAAPFPAPHYATAASTVLRFVGDAGLLPLALPAGVIERVAANAGVASTRTGAGGEGDTGARTGGGSSRRKRVDYRTVAGGGTAPSSVVAGDIEPPRGARGPLASAAADAVTALGRLLQLPSTAAPASLPGGTDLPPAAADGTVAGRDRLGATPPSADVPAPPGEARATAAGARSGVSPSSAAAAAADGSDKDGGSVLVWGKSLRQFVRDRDDEEQRELRAEYYDSDDTWASSGGLSEQGGGAVPFRAKRQHHPSSGGAKQHRRSRSMEASPHSSGARPVAPSPAPLPAALPQRAASTNAIGVAGWFNARLPLLGGKHAAPTLTLPPVTGAPATAAAAAAAAAALSSTADAAVEADPPLSSRRRALSHPVFSSGTRAAPASAPPPGARSGAPATTASDAAPPSPAPTSLGEGSEDGSDTAAAGGGDAATRARARTDTPSTDLEDVLLQADFFDVAGFWPAKVGGGDDDSELAATGGKKQKLAGGRALGPSSGSAARMRELASSAASRLGTGINGIASMIRMGGGRIRKVIEDRGSSGQRQGGFGPLSARLSSAVAAGGVAAAAFGGMARRGATGGAARGSNSRGSKRSAAPSAGAAAAAVGIEEAAALAGVGGYADMLTSLLTTGRVDVRVSGTLIITERNVYFHSSRNEVLVIPLGSVVHARGEEGSGIDYVSSSVRTLGLMRLGRTSDNALRLPACEVRRVVVDPEAQPAGAPAGMGASPLAVLFSLVPALRGARVPLAVTAAAPAAAVAVAPPAPLADVPPAASHGTLVPAHTVTLVFSKMKDFVLGRGEERRAGGRRRVIREALDELVAAHAVSVEYEALLQTLVKSTDDDAAAAAVAGGAASAATAPAAAAASIISRDDGSLPSTPKAQPSWAISPWLFRAASGGVTLGALLRGRPTTERWKALLTRSRSEDAVFPRRLQLLSAMNLIRTRALLKATGRLTPALQLCSVYLQSHEEGAVHAIKRFMLQDDPRWLMQLAAWASHDREIRRRRMEQLSEFDRRRFREEMDVVLDYFVFPANSLRNMVLYLIAWETPVLSASAFAALLLVVWHNLLGYAIPLLLLCHAAGILLYGSMQDDLRAGVGNMLGRDRGARARNILERLRNFRSSLGIAQARMHRLNTIVLKLRSLYTWKEPSRTRLFLLALLLLAVLFSVVPLRVLFAAFVVAQFTRPLRSKENGVASLALRRFWGGLPVPSVADPVYYDLSDELEMAPYAEKVDRLLPLPPPLLQLPVEDLRRDGEGAAIMRATDVAVAAPGGGQGAGGT